MGCTAVDPGADSQGVQGRIRGGFTGYPGIDPGVDPGTDPGEVSVGDGVQR